MNIEFDEKELFSAKKLHLVKLPDENTVRIGYYNDIDDSVYIFSTDKTYPSSDCKSIMLTPSRRIYSMSDRYGFDCYPSDNLSNIINNGSKEVNLLTFDPEEFVYGMQLTKQQIFNYENMFQRKLKYYNLNKLIYNEKTNTIGIEK